MYQRSLNGEKEICTSFLRADKLPMHPNTGPPYGTVDIRRAHL